MRSVLIRKIGGIVGLLAILLTTLVPAASQMLESGRIESTLASFCSADVASPKHAPIDHATHFQACAYCNFAAHTPFMAPPKYAQRVASRESRTRVPVPGATAKPYTPILAAEPRAPPSFA